MQWQKFAIAVCFAFTVQAGPVKGDIPQRGFTGDTLWISGQDLTLEGAGWLNQNSPFQRLPDSAQALVSTKLWELSRHSAGICVRFLTDASAIAARWTLLFEQLEMPHMPATGVSGVDLYFRDSDRHWRWLGNSLPKNFPQNTHVLITGLKAEKREYCLYLPLYNGVASVEIGVPTEAELIGAPPRPAWKQRPLVFYGTSIIQGGCASRPGMASPAIVGRHLDRPIVNLGFSGNGRMDPSVALLLAQIDAEVFIIDCLPNMTDSLLQERAFSFIQTLCRRQPDTPVLLVESCWPSNAAFKSDLQEQLERKAATLQRIYQELVQSGFTQLHYLTSRDQLGIDGEGTVDGVHPSDLGFHRQALHYIDALLPILQPVQKKSAPGQDQDRK